MTKIASEYERYQASSIMKKLAAIAHGQNYREQTSSATFDEIACLIQKMELSPGSRVLDAGCGNGAFSIPLAEMFSFQVEGIDLSQELIKEAVAKASRANLTSRCQFFVGDFSSFYDHSSTSFDLVLSIGSLYWGQSLVTTLKNWHHITHQGGGLILFLNLEYQPLHATEIESIGNTKFVPAISLQRELTRAGWVISDWTDATEIYIEWLNRWCSAMREINHDIMLEMGKEAGSQLIQRFTTYLQLAQRNAVRRIILRTEHV